MKKIGVLAAGGTGGHIIPAIAIGNELKKLGVEIIFIGNKNGMEKKLAGDFNFKGIDVQKLYRKLTYKHLFFPYKFIKSIYNSYKIISKFKPDFFLGTGGFVSGPVGLAAKLYKLPIFIQEQNSYPGITNKFLGKYAEFIFLAYNNAKPYFPDNKIIFSGNPVNPTVFDTSEIDYSDYGLKKESFKIFLLGGSQGSRFLNKNLYPIIDKLLEEKIEIIWQTGRLDIERYKNLTKEGLYIFDFTKEMGKIYNSVNLVIGRAGAITLEEIKTKKIPSILVPLSIAAGNHQYFNALENFNKGFCEIIKEKDMSPDKLYHTIKKIISNYDKYKSALDKVKVQNSAKVIAEKIYDKIYKEEK